MLDGYPYARQRFRSNGFSLIEIMVGLVLGMISVLVIMQVYTGAESRKRTTTGAGDAQSAGAIALYALQRDIRQSGFGINSTSLLGCDLTLPSGKTIPLVATTINPPATLVPVGDSNTDTLLVAYGSSNAQAYGQPIISRESATYAVANSASFAVNDYVIEDGGNCQVATPPTLSLDTIASVDDATHVTLASGGGSGSILTNLGATPKIVAYAIRSGNLTMCDYVGNDCSVVGNWRTIANNIVSLRAEYGFATQAATSNYFADSYGQTLPTTPTDFTSLPATCVAVRTPAIRISLTSRSQQYEKDVVTTAAPSWEGSTDTPINLTSNTDWQHYRYRVFQTVVPLRNITWMGVQSGC